MARAVKRTPDAATERPALPVHLAPIPDRHAFKIGEAGALVGVKAHVLRFWEQEFQQLAPRKGTTGHRLYTRAEVELLRRIRALLHDRGYTIAGARSVLSEGLEAMDAALAARPVEAAAALDEASGRVTQLEAALAAEGERRRLAERGLARARDEAAFWRAETLRGERALEALRGALRDELDGLARIFGRLDEESDTRPHRTLDSEGDHR